MNKLLFIKILIGLLIVQVLVVIGLSGFFYFNTGMTRNRCLANQEQVAEAAEAFRSGLATDKAYPDTLEELKTSGRLKEIPKCPSGGTYSWSPIEGRVYCNVAGHN